LRTPNILAEQVVLQPLYVSAIERLHGYSVHALKTGRSGLRETGITPAKKPAAGRGILASALLILRAR